MMEIVLPVVGVLLAVGGSLFKLARDVRLHDSSIRHADQDLASWVDDDSQDFTRLRIKVHNQQKRDELSRGEAHSLLQRTRRELRTRYRNELRRAERVVQQVRDVEHWPHGIYRRLAQNPVPELTAPDAKSHVLETWEPKQPYQDWADPPGSLVGTST